MMTKSLTDEQKQQVVDEVRHYLMMDSYDFGIHVGEFDLLAGELANIEDEESEERPFVDPDTGLVPCPFCGEKAVISHSTITGEFIVGCRTTKNGLGLPCPGSLVRQKASSSYPTAEIAKLSWNQRIQKGDRHGT